MAVTPPQRVGMLGGAFDPPHRAHQALAEAAVDQLQLDVLHVVPTGHAWHKARTLTPAVHRLAMAQAAFGALARVQVDDREMHRPGPSYTADTLAELAAEYPGATLHLVMGADQAAALPQWHAWEDVLRLAIISIAGRAYPAGAAGQFDLKTMSIARLAVLTMPPIAVSATAIRERIATGAPIGDLVAAGVARYIDLHHLYRTT